MGLWVCLQTLLPQGWEWKEERMILLGYSRFLLQVKVDQEQLFDKSYIKQRTKLQLPYFIRGEEKKSQGRFGCWL